MDCYVTALGDYEGRKDVLNEEAMESSDHIISKSVLST
jgi:hypothetical protein